ncbi:MAG: hypothetical protein JNL11_14095 [Bdellovibrionaceae bacterium]|nr:hypothetical protein [Pseudobdellovibrionaceae bacterium]
MKAFKNYLQKIYEGLDHKNKLIIFFVIGFFLVGYSHLKPVPKDADTNRFQIDTIIPEGYVLIPIEVLNADSISAVIGSHGVADIYSTVQGEKAKRLFSRARIIKSPLNEASFAVLVKETKAYLLSQSKDPFFAAVQNPKARAYEQEIPRKQTSTIKIIYQN